MKNEEMRSKLRQALLGIGSSLGEDISSPDMDDLMLIVEVLKALGEPQGTCGRCGHHVVLHLPRSQTPSLGIAHAYTCFGCKDRRGTEEKALCWSDHSEAVS